MMKKIPPPPEGVGTCSNCKHRIKGEAETFYLDLSGSLTPAAVVDMGGGGSHIDLGKTTKIVLAPCAVGPNWIPTAADHWCHQFSRIVTNEMARRAARGVQALLQDGSETT